MFLPSISNCGQISFAEPQGVTLRGIPTHRKVLHTHLRVLELLTVKMWDWPFTPCDCQSLIFRLCIARLTYLAKYPLLMKKV